MRSLSGLDAALLQLETPSTAMNIVAALVLDPSTSGAGHDYERVFRVMEARLARLEPFRRRLLSVPLGLDQPVWIDDPDFRARNHIYRLRAPAPGSERVFAELVAQLASQPLDRTRPLWELCVVEGLWEGRVALVFRLHHAVADGVAATRLLLELFDPSPEGADSRASDELAKPDPIPTSRALLAHAFSRVPERVARFVHLFRDTAESVARMARSTGEAAAELRMPMPFSGPRMPWNGATSPRRTVAFGTVRLADVKLVASAFGTTVNDVVLAACARALRNYLEAHAGVPDSPLVAAIPISLRRPDELGRYGNRISAFLVRLPVHLADPVEQLRSVHREARSSRQLYSDFGIGALGEWAEFASPALLGVGARVYSAGKLADRHRPVYNVAISNVRGPSTPLYFAGSRLVAAYPLGPLLEGVGLNITVVSYMESIDIGVIACEPSVPHATDIALGFGTAVADLTKLALDKATEVPPAAFVGWDA